MAVLRVALGVCLLGRLCGGPENPCGWRTVRFRGVQHPVYGMAENLRVECSIHSLPTKFTSKIKFFSDQKTEGSTARWHIGGKAPPRHPATPRLLAPVPSLMPRRRRSVARWLRGLVLRGLCPAPSLDCVGGYWGVDVPFGVVGNGELSARGIFVEKSGTTVAQVSCNSPSTQAAQLACHPAAPPTQLPSSDSRSLGCTVSPRRVARLLGLSG